MTTSRMNAGRRIFILYALLLTLLSTCMAQSLSLPPSQRIVINMGQTPWRFEVGQDPVGAQNPGFDDSTWQAVGLPNSADQLDTFTNETSGGGAGDLTGNTDWYRQHFSIDSQYANSKVQVVFEGVHTGVQVYINGMLIPGTQSFAPQATHVIGFLPFIVDLTPYINFGGDNVIAVRVARNADWFPNPGFSGAFRFGQSDNGIFRPVYMYITDKVYIPENVYSGSKTWGTYVATDTTSDDSATIHVQTNVMNEGTDPQDVTLTTEIVDSNGSVVATKQDDQTIAPSSHNNPQPALFDQVLTVSKPTLWYPNNSIYGKPYMYKVFHTLSLNGVVIDSKQSPLGIRTVTWDKDYVYINGKIQKLWGASGRYDYPGLGTSVPEEQKWRDLQQMAAMGGNLWRPGHSSESEEFVNAADALGIMVVQPSGDLENYFADPCDTGSVTCAQEQLKLELHRDMIVRDRSHPSILAWEADNGVTLPAFAQQIAAVGKQWDYLGGDGPMSGQKGGRAQSDRSGGDPQYANNGDFMSCSQTGCDIGVKQGIPDKPAWGAEYWGPGVIRQDHDHEISMAAQYIDAWSRGIAAHTFGLAQWYFADSPGEEGVYTDLPQDTPDEDTERSIGDSMVDFERFPRLLYYIEAANWLPFLDNNGNIYRPIVKLANTWNRSGNIQVNAWSNCPSVRLLVNGIQQGQDQVPNPSSSQAENDNDFVATEQTTTLPGQVHWNVTWQSGSAVAVCLNQFGAAVNDPISGTPVTDVLTTAGPADHIVLENVPNVTRPDGTGFQVTANGSDAAFVIAKVVDANGVVVPNSSDLLTFSVSGPGTYVGGTQQMVDPTQPYSFHAPGSPELAAEGGLQKIAIKSQFTPGVVTVTTTSPNLKGATTSFNIYSIPQSTPPATAPTIIAQPVDTSVTTGFPAHFSVTASGADPLTFQWFKNGAEIPSANTATLTTDSTTDSDNKASFSVTVSNSLGSVTSNAAILSVVAAAPPAITTQPLSQTVDAGQTATFSVTATGSPTLVYQWTDNNVAIPGAISSAYTTQTLDTTENGHAFAVTVKNPVSSITSAVATLTVNPARPPVITTQPVNVTTLPGQPATFSVAVAGSQPLIYIWQKSGLTVGSNSPTLTIASVSNGDLGSYTVTVSNSAGTVTSSAATLSLAPPGVNMSLGKIGLGSSFEDPVGLASQFAIDGDITTRWGSAFSDPQSYQIDFGVPMTFNRVIMTWDPSFATQYDIEVSNDGNNWGQPVYSQPSGTGGVEDFTFPTQQARFIRMFGTQRNDAYGYSIHEFATYNAPACGDSNERWSINPNNVNNDGGLATDNLSGLSWTRAQATDNMPGAQFTQASAINYCQGLGMRIPTRDEALAISGTSAASCAFPVFWSTWTSTDWPDDSTRAYNVDSTGSVFAGIKVNSPGATLCVQGDTQTPPVITAQPAPTTVEANQTASFSVAATTTGTGLVTYTWLKNSVAFQVTGVPTVTTPLIAAADNGALYSVIVTGGNGLITTSNTALLTVNGTATPPTGNPGGDNPGGGGGNGGGNGGNGNTNDTDTAIAGFGAGPVPQGPNLALGKQTTSSGDESAAYPPNQAADGDLTTRWSSEFSDQAWIQLDLGSVQAIGQVDLRWERAFGAAYTIQVSADGQNWITAFTQTNGQGGSENLVFPAVNGRYVRMAGVKRSSQYGYSLWEFEVYGPVLPTIITQPVNQTVVAGAQAQFTVVATGNGLLTYQWFRNGVAITGATSATYTTPALSIADSASLFTVTVTNTSGSVTSAGASVTVTDPTPGIANLALGKTATSSDNENNGLGAANAVDGDLTTRWSSAFADASWLEVDLGSPLLLNKAVLRWEAAYGKAYQIQVSNDEQTWNTVFTQTNGQGGMETITFPSVIGRYIRMNGIARATQYGYSLFEFEVYGADVPAIVTQPLSQTVNSGATATFTVTAGGDGPFTYQWLRDGVAIPGAIAASYTTPVLMSPDSGSVFTVAVTNATGTATSTKAVLTVNAAAPTGTNLALNQPVKESGSENDGTLGAANAVDGSLTTRWSSAFLDASWIEVDLGTPKTIGQVVLNWENAYGKAYQIQLSNDEQTWNTVYTQTAGVGGVENLTFPPAAGRYVRMLGVTRATQYGYSLYEFQIYAAANAPTITTQPANQTANVGATATFSVAAGGSGPFTYQWLKNGVAIAAATASSYTTPLLAASDDGSRYSVTIGNANGTVTSMAATLSVNNSGTSYTIYPGFIGTDLNNNTNGAWADNQVFVTVMGIDPATGVFAWVKPDGTITDAKVADNDATGHLTKNGQNYPNYSFTLAQSKLLKLPEMDSGRVFISLGEPVYLKVLADANGNIGYAGPNPQNTADPNVDVHFDWYEFTYNSIGVFINTTQVDEFGLPLLLDVWGNSRTFHQQTGIVESIAALDQEYANETPAEFHTTPINNLRIMSPTKTTFGAGGANANYFDAYVDSIWGNYSTTPLTIDLFGGTRRFSGTTAATSFTFSEVNLNNGAFSGNTYTIAKPSTQDILQCSGTMASGSSNQDINTVELALEAQFCAAFNRHAMMDVSTWGTSSAWYSAQPANFYAQFWHKHSVGGLAYGFAYDDVSNQSSTITTGTPEHMAFGIGW